MSTPANFRNGKTLSLIDTCLGIGSCVIPSSLQRHPGHDFGGDVGNRDTRRFGNEGSGPAGSRIDFQNIQNGTTLFGLDRELNVHQTDDV